MSRDKGGLKLVRNGFGPPLMEAVTPVLLI